MSNSLNDELNKITNNEFEKITNMSPMEKYLDIHLDKNIKSYLEKIDNSHFKILDKNDEEKVVFVKYITFVDYVKYLIGKYKDDDTDVLPLEGEIKTSFEKNINSHLNYAYVDTLFYYISSEIMDKYPNFLHGIKCYDPFVTMKKNFRVNIADDFEYLSDSTFLMDNLNAKFVFENKDIHNIINEKNAFRSRGRS